MNLTECLDYRREHPKVTNMTSASMSKTIFPIILSVPPLVTRPMLNMGSPNSFEFMMINNIVKCIKT